MVETLEYLAEECDMVFIPVSKELAEVLMFGESVPCTFRFEPNQFHPLLLDMVVTQLPLGRSNRAKGS